MTAVIRMPGQNGAGAVELFGEDDAGEFMGEGDGAEGEEEVGAGAGGGGPAISGADGEEELLDAAVAEGAEVGCEISGGELLAGGVEQDDVERGARGGFIGEGEEGGLGGEEVGVAGVVAGDAGGVVGEEGVERGGFGAGAGGRDGGEMELHILHSMPEQRGRHSKILRSFAALRMTEHIELGPGGPQGLKPLSLQKAFPCGLKSALPRLKSGA